MAKAATAFSKKDESVFDFEKAVAEARAQLEREAALKAAMVSGTATL